LFFVLKIVEEPKNGDERREMKDSTEKKVGKKDG
jgi:hypothetical protein